MEKEVRMADCHPDRKHFGLGLCSTCYGRELYHRRIAKMSSEELKAFRSKGAAAARKRYKDDPEKARAITRKYYWANPEKCRAVSRKFHHDNYRSNPDYQRKLKERAIEHHHNGGYLKKYGISKAEYDKMNAEQGGRCLICRQEPSDGKLSVDHAHAGKKRVRALLDRKCNSLIGFANDDPAILGKAIEYLKSWRDNGCVNIKPVNTPNDSFPEFVPFGQFKYNLKKRYGIVLDDYKAFYSKQRGCCAICGNPEKIIKLGRLVPLSVDHDHRLVSGTPSVRSVLCNACNSVVGQSGESIEILQAAIDYLNKFSELPSECRQ